MCGFSESDVKQSLGPRVTGDGADADLMCSPDFGRVSVVSAVNVIVYRTIT